MRCERISPRRRRAAIPGTAWRWSLTGASAAAFAVALADPIPSLRDGLYVTSGKAAIAAAGRWALPLRIALAGTEKTRSRGER